MVEVENVELQNETQDPSTPVSHAGENAREPSSAQDDRVNTGDRGWIRSGCLDHEKSEFEKMLRVLAEC